MKTMRIVDRHNGNIKIACDYCGWNTWDVEMANTTYYCPYCYSSMTVPKHPDENQIKGEDMPRVVSKEGEVIVDNSKDRRYGITTMDRVDDKIKARCNPCGHTFWILKKELMSAHCPGCGRSIFHQDTKKGLLTPQKKDKQKNVAPPKDNGRDKSGRIRKVSINDCYEFEGEKLKVKEWAKRFDIVAGTLSSRLARGLSIEEALAKPVTTIPSVGKRRMSKRIGYVTVGNRSLTPTAWGNEPDAQVSPTTICSRIRAGWDPVTAIFTTTRGKLILPSILDPRKYVPEVQEGEDTPKKLLVKPDEATDNPRGASLIITPKDTSIWVEIDPLEVDNLIHIIQQLRGVKLVKVAKTVWKTY